MRPLVMRDRTDEARAEVKRILEIEPDHSIEAFMADNRSLEEKSLQHFLDGLRQAGLPE
jgi:hypothetical protein